MRRTTTPGWLFEDHFGYGHIQFQVEKVFWIKHYETFEEAASEAHRFGLISPLQMESICRQDQYYARWIPFVVERAIETERFVHRGFSPLETFEVAE